jgi:hypothetical protein
MSMLHDVLDPVSGVTPEERLAAFQIDASSAALIKRIHCCGDFLKGHVAVSTTRDPAVSAAEVAFIGKHQTTDERDRMAQKTVMHQILHAVSDRFHDPPLLLMYIATSRPKNWSAGKE